MAEIFISYRRDDSRYQARMIYDALTRVVPRDRVFDMRYFDMRRYEYAARALDETGRLVGAWTRANASAA